MRPSVDDASGEVADALGDLLNLIPPPERTQVFSTLRSVEWRHKLEIRTMYAVGSNGRPATHQERVVAETVAAEKPVPRRDMLIRAGGGLAVALLLLGLSALFIDYPKLWRNLTATVEPVQVQVDRGTFGPYLDLEVKSLDHKTGMLLLSVHRLARYPLTDADLDKLYEHPLDNPAASVPAVVPAATTPAATAPATVPATTGIVAVISPPPGLLRRRLAIEALARGSIHLDLYDEHDNFLGPITLRIAALQEKPAIEISVPAPTLSGSPIAPKRIALEP